MAFIPRITPFGMALATALALSACASTRSATPAPTREAHARPTEVATRQSADAAPVRTPRSPKEARSAAATPEREAEPQWGNRFYLDDGPGDRPTAELDQIPDAVPVAEPLNRFTSQPYSVFGRTYTPMDQPGPFSERGLASWYGRRFHGKSTASGEPYDMYAMSAAHPTLPIPSYARVTNLDNGRSVVVRINDRGPFHPGRVMDLSYAAAHRLGYAKKGSAEVIVEAVQPASSNRIEAPTVAAPVTTAASGVARATPIPTQVENSNAPALERTASRNAQGAPAADQLWLQLGAFGSRDNAESLKQAVTTKLPQLAPGLTVIETNGKWRVRIGPLYDREAMDYVRKTLKEKMGIAAFAVKP